MSEKTNKSDDASPKGCIVSDEEMAFYKKLFPSFDIITKRKIHCTVCRGHLGAAPGNADNIKMHPVLRVMQCSDCHEFYSSGEFSRGEDGSELYCRWCGQGGQVYCCSSCPFVFCKSCIVENLNKGVVRDIEENDSWNCFSCSTKIIWPIRAMHWALTEYMAKEKRLIMNGNHSPSQIEELLAQDNSTCCKNKTLNKSASSTQKRRATQSPQITQQPNKKTRNSLPKISASSTLAGMPNILEPTCQITSPIAPPPLVMQSHQMTANMLNKQPQYRIPANIKTTVRPAIRPNTLNRVPSIQPRMSAPRNNSLGGGATTIRLSNNQMTANQTQRRQISTITATTTNTSGPVYHTINGYRIDLNSASKQDNFRLPNGKLIQVKRQVPVIPGAQPNQPVSSTVTSSTPSYSVNPYMRPPVRPQVGQQQQQIVIQRNQQVPQQQFIIHSSSITQPTQIQPQPTQAPIQYRQIPQLQPPTQNQNPVPPGVIGQQNIALKSIPTFVKHIFPSTPLGMARNTLQSQLFHTMEICHHLMTKTHTLTNSNAYKTVHNLMDIKELYIHLSYLLTYAIGRFKGLQEKCLNDMKALGFTQEAKNLERGQLAKDNSTNHNDDDLAIVEPQRDTIELDSDVEEDIPRIKIEKQDKHTLETTLNSLNLPASSNFESNSESEDIDLNLAADLLAGMLEVELTEGEAMAPPKPKFPRTKTTKRKQRPNSPTTQAERAKIKSLQGLKDSDKKLKMNCKVILERVAVPSSPAAKDSTIENEKSTNENAQEEKDSTEVSTSNNKEDSVTNDNNESKEDESKKVDESNSSEKEMGENDKINTDQHSEDTDKVSVIDLDEDEEKTDNPKELEKSDDGLVTVIDLDDDDDTEKEKTSAEEEPQSQEIIDLDDEDDKLENSEENKKSSDKKMNESEDVLAKDKEIELPVQKTNDLVEKSNDIFEISEDEEDLTSNEKNDGSDNSNEIIGQQEKNKAVDEIAEEKTDDQQEETVTSESDKKQPEHEEKSEKNTNEENDIIKVSDKNVIVEDKSVIAENDVDEQMEMSITEEVEATENSVDGIVSIPTESENVDSSENQETDNPAEVATIENPETEISALELIDSQENTETQVSAVELMDLDNLDEDKSMESVQKDLQNSASPEKGDQKMDTSNDSDLEFKDCQEDSKVDSKTSDYSSQSTDKNSNGKVIVDGKELDENDFESSSSSEDEDEEQRESTAPTQEDSEMKDLDSKETQSNGFGSENSSSNFDLIESMIKENLSVPSQDKNLIDEGNSGILATTANEV